MGFHVLDLLGLPIVCFKLVDAAASGMPCTKTEKELIEK